MKEQKTKCHENSWPCCAGGSSLMEASMVWSIGVQRVQADDHFLENDHIDSNGSDKATSFGAFELDPLHKTIKALWSFWSGASGRKGCCTSRGESWRGGTMTIQGVVCNTGQHYATMYASIILKMGPSLVFSRSVVPCLHVLCIALYMCKHLPSNSSYLGIAFLACHDSYDSRQS